jgi:hypothetical protein
MFDRHDSEVKLSQLMQEQTASQFGDDRDDSVVYEVEAERDYVNRLRVQREKVPPVRCRSKPCTPSTTCCCATSSRRTSRSGRRTVNLTLARNHR